MSSTLLILVFLAAIIVAVVALPRLNGLGGLTVQRTQRGGAQQDQQEDDSYEGYLPPHELKRREEARKKKDSRLAKLKQNLTITMEDAPVKFTSSSSSGRTTRLRRRGARQVDPSDRDPSKFDFDLDELIADEAREDAEEQKREFEGRAAKSPEQLEELV